MFIYAIYQRVSGSEKEPSRIMNTGRKALTSRYKGVSGVKKMKTCSTKSICCILIPHLHAEIERSKKSNSIYFADSINYNEKPIVVATGNQDNDTVIDYDYIFDKFNIPEDTSLKNFVSLTGYEIKDLDIAFPDTEHLKTVRKEILSILSRFSPEIETPKMNKYYVDLTGTEHLLGRAIDSAEKIIRLIKERLGVTAKAGIGKNILVASTAAILSENNSVYEILSEREFIAQTPVSIIPLMPESAKQFLIENYNITKMGEISRLTEKDIPPLPYGYGKILHKYSQGIARNVLITDSKKKVTKFKIIFPEKVTAHSIKKALADTIFEASLEAVKNGTLPRKFSLAITYQDGYTVNLSGTFRTTEISKKEMLEDIFPYINRAMRRRIKLKSILLSLSSSIIGTEEQYLFPELKKSTSLEKAIASIAKKYGKKIIHYGE